MQIQARTLIGADAVTIEQGQQIYDAIHISLQSSQAVTIDFAGVEVFTSSFLNAAFGQLYRDLSSEQLRHQLQVTEMPSYAQKLLRRVTMNAVRYYHDAPYRSAMTAVLDDYAKEA